jgi:hypothetical protein
MILDDKIVRGRPFAAALMDRATPPGQMATDEQVVAALIKRPNSIGFLRYPSYGQLDKRVRVLGIIPSKGAKPVFPTTATIADGSYPLTDSLTLYLQPAAPPSAREFCQFAAGPEGAKIVKQCGLWPELELNEVRGAQRLKDVKAHRGVEVAVCGSPALQGMIKELAVEFSKAKTAVEISAARGHDPPVWAAGRRPHQPTRGKQAPLPATRQGPAQGRYRQADPGRSPRSAGHGCDRSGRDANGRGLGEGLGAGAVLPGRKDLRADGPGGGREEREAGGRETPPTPRRWKR